MDNNKIDFMILYGEYKPGFANTFAKVYSSNKTETAFEKWMDDILSNKDNLKLIKTDINNFVKDISFKHFQNENYITIKYIDYLISAGKTHVVKINDGYTTKDEIRVLNKNYDPYYFYDNFLDDKSIRKEKFKNLFN
jgi:hypothetical protein